MNPKTDRLKENKNDRFLFTEHMAGGAFVCRAQEGHEMLYANENMVRLFECDDYAEFVSFIGGSYDGMMTNTQAMAINKEIDLQVRGLKKTSGHLFYHVKTKKGNLHLVEEHWSLIDDQEEGPLFYCFIVSREFENAGSDYDPITGLYGKKRFQKYVLGKNRNCLGKDDSEYAVAYLNFVNFKLLNINRGIEEGDACLRTIADILSQIFEEAFLARLSDDHFAIFAKYEGLLAKLEEFNRQFHNVYGSQFDIVGKCGIYRYTCSEDFDVESALSYAKVACDYIKYDSQMDIVEYTSKLAKRMLTAEHVVRKLDEAIEKEWIKIFYQSVVRSITEQLCGMESLVRWIDPELGFILPSEFIKALEDNRQIHKLDCYVVEKVCQCIHDRMKSKMPIVPISVNFSRLDFAMCDILKVLEENVEKYDIPRDYLHVEITESMIASDEEMMRRVINDFRKAGYEIWMDDFGSGYSSLTLLKDYQFDMLKLDMRFLTPFTERAKDIVRHTVSMAKDIGIKTLAEGVETKEQLEFLKQIGCGQIQGYYYGRPELMDDMFLHLKEKKIPIEKRLWRNFYQVASTHVRATDIPLEIIEDDGKNFRTLFMNKAYREQIIKDSLSLEEMDQLIYQTPSPLPAKYREFADIIEKSGKPETFYYTNNGNYICFRGEALAQCSGHYIIKGSLVNISISQNVQESERLDSKIRELNQLFDAVFLANIKQKSIMPLLGGTQYLDIREDTGDNLKKYKDMFGEKCIFPTEKERYNQLMEWKTMQERIKQTGKGYLADVFRVKQENGEYEQKEIFLMIISGTGGNEFLFCIKPFLKESENAQGSMEALLTDMGNKNMLSGIIWENLLCSSSIKFFWKDKERRFRGASQSFLDYYGIQSLSEIIGKTDEEMHWHVDDIPYKEDEEAILTKGERVMDVPGQCIVKGVVRNISCSKMPLYLEGKIVGLIGLFVDKDERSANARNKAETLKRDSATGLMNARTLVEYMIDYALQYHNRGRNYGLIVLQNSRHSRIVETYDEKFGNMVLREMGKSITGLAGRHSVVARTRDSVFAILMYVRQEKDIHELAAKIKERLDGIKEVEGNAVTMRIRMSVKVRTDARITDENIYDTALREITEVY